jgi:hypothetical protein
MEQLCDHAKHIRAISFAVVAACAALFVAVDIADVNRAQNASEYLLAIDGFREELAKVGSEGQTEWFEDSILNAFERSRDALLASMDTEWVSETNGISDSEGNLLTLDVDVEEVVDELFLYHYRQKGIPQWNFESLGGFRDAWTYLITTTARIPVRQIPIILRYEQSEPNNVPSGRSRTINLDGASFEFAYAYSRSNDEAFGNDIDELDIGEILNSGTYFGHELRRVDEQFREVSRSTLIADSNDSIEQSDDLIFQVLLDVEFTPIEIGGIPTLHPDATRVLGAYVLAFESEPRPLPWAEHLASLAPFQNVALRHGSFESVFRNLVLEMSSLSGITSLDNLYSMPFSELSEIMVVRVADAQHEQTISDDVEVAGLQLPAENVLKYGIIIIAIVQLYLLIHLIQFNTKIRELKMDADVWGVPWMGLYHSYFARCATLLANVGLPVGTSIILVIIGGQSNNDITYAAAGLSAILAFGTLIVLAAIWIKQAGQTKVSPVHRA